MMEILGIIVALSGAAMLVKSFLLFEKAENLPSYQKYGDEYNRLMADEGVLFLFGWLAFFIGIIFAFA